MMFPIFFPDHCFEQFSKFKWIEDLAGREAAVIIPLAEWFREGNHKYEDIPPGLQTEIFYKDEKNRIIQPSSQWLFWGFTKEDMVNTEWLKKVHPDDRYILEEKFYDFKYEERVSLSQNVYRVIDSEGKYHWILSSASAVERSESGELSLFIGRDVEIGPRIERELALEREIEEIGVRSARDKALMEAGGLIAGVTDRDALYDAVEQASKSILSLDDFRLIIVKDSELSILLGKDLPPAIDVKKLFSAADERYGKIRISKSYIAWSLGELTGGRGVALFHILPGYNDDTKRIMSVFFPLVLRAWEQISRLEELRRHATTDPLTNIWNRRAFLQQAGILLRRSMGENNSVTVVMLDIDHFKRINDEFGHPYGDKVLVNVADAMNRSLRSGDLICRWGGEEFALFLNRIGGDEAVQIAERIRRSVEASSGVGMPAVTLSAGVRTINPVNPETLEAALKHADDALLRAKAEGRNRLCVSGRINIEV